MRSIKFDWDDIAIIPEGLSTISSRSEIDNTYNGLLPIFTSPMDMVIDSENSKVFSGNNINVCLPRNVKYDSLNTTDYFYSYGVDEIIELLNNSSSLPKRILIDVANGHMKKVYDVSKLIKKRFGDNVELMVGNIANPDTYKHYCDIGVDYIRCGIGAGSACTTSANASIHYPMASLISECYEISKHYHKPAKIVADGGFKSYSDVIKALALGADYVMLGGIFNKCLESCSPSYIKVGNNYKQIDMRSAVNSFNDGDDVYKYYRGMSTKEVQRSWKRSVLKTSEGITKYNKVEYTLSGWCDNFSDYLKSTMSYSNSRNLEEFIGEALWVKISNNAFNRFNK